jgi:recombination protein RecT
VSNAITPIQQVRSVIESPAMRSEIQKALPPHVTVDRFVRITLTAIQGSPDLLNQDRQSLYGACMKCAQAGLIPDGREAALVPFKGKVQFMPMVEGLMKQVRNSGEIANISVQIVKENDEFDYELGDNERIVHKPALKGRGEIIGAYSIVTLKNGEKSREWMDIEELLAIRDRGAKNGPWVTDPGEMCRKTVFRRHYKRLPKSTDLDDLIREDDEITGVVQQPAPVSEPKEAVGEVKDPAAASRPSRLQAVADQVLTDTPADPAPTDTTAKPGDPI